MLYSAMARKRTDIFIDDEAPEAKRRSTNILEEQKQQIQQVRGPTTWTIIRHNGPNHLGL